MSNVEVTLDDGTIYLVLAVLRQNGKPKATLKDAKDATQTALRLLLETSPKAMHNAPEEAIKGER